MKEVTDQTDIEARLEDFARRVPPARSLAMMMIILKGFRLRERLRLPGTTTPPHSIFKSFRLCFSTRVLCIGRFVASRRDKYDNGIFLISVHDYWRTQLGTPTRN